MSLKYLSAVTSQASTASDTSTVSCDSGKPQTPASEGTAAIDQVTEGIKGFNIKDISVPDVRDTGSETLLWKTTTPSPNPAFLSGGPLGGHWPTGEETTRHSEHETPTTMSRPESTSSQLSQTSPMAGDGRSIVPDGHETPLLKTSETTGSGDGEHLVVNASPTAVAHEQESPQPSELPRTRDRIARDVTPPPEDEPPPGTG